MTFSKERFDKMRSLISAQRVLVHKLCGSSVYLSEESEVYYINLLDYIENNHDRSLYTLPLLRKAIKTENLNDILKVVQFFTSDLSELFEIKYCYEQENMEYVEIHVDEYRGYIQDKIEPVTIDGAEIENFNPKYLSFYCLINLD
ncbi:TPA: hypothetical protein OUA92_000951 [Enterobacter hormaechei]|nr:hypothetical protein [Enterobacter hormaechei]